MTRFNLLLLAALLASSVYLVRVSYEARRLFTELDRTQAEQRRLATEFGRLQADRQAEGTPLRVEKTARDKLQMQRSTPAIAHYVLQPGLAGAGDGTAAAVTATALTVAGATR